MNRFSAVHLWVTGLSVGICVTISIFMLMSDPLDEAVTRGIACGVRLQSEISCMALLGIKH